MKQYRELMIQGNIIRGFEHKVSEKVVVFFHGFTGNKAESGRLFYHLADDLAKQGYSVLRFDWLGHGESDLEFSEIRVPLLQEQAKTVLNYAKKHYRTIYLLGFSMGGSFAMNQVDEDIDGLVLLAPAYHMSDVKERYFQDDGKDEHDLYGFVLHRAFAFGFHELDMLENAMKYTGQVIIIQGENDQSVPKELSIQLNDKLQDSTLHIIKNADHCFHNREQHRDVSRLITSFLSKK